jgi:hypothetical protein
MLHAGLKVEDTGLEVSCSWGVENKKCINDTITLGTDSKDGKK